MTKGSYPDLLDRQADEAEEIGATALLGPVYRRIARKLRELGVDGGNGDEHCEPEADRMLRAPEVAGRLGISRRTVYAAARKGGWPFVRRLPGGSVRFSEKGLNRWLERQR